MYSGSILIFLTANLRLRSKRGKGSNQSHIVNIFISVRTPLLNIEAHCYWTVVKQLAPAGPQCYIYMIVVSAVS